MNSISPLKTRFICPICHTSLNKQNHSFICENSHCFDISKEGYVNLLTVQQKKSKNPGDNKIMIQSRKNFLNNHHYDILIDSCTEIINKSITEQFHVKEYNSQTNAQYTLLDIGCGDGYFTRHIFSRFLKNATCYGMDISKEAVRFSAKNNKTIHWVVASQNEIPLSDNSIDVILKINAPLNYDKCRRKLSNKGFVVSITPGKYHLNGLKSIIYETPQLHEDEPCPESYTLLNSQQLNAKIYLTNETDIKNLFMMTPFFWNASQKSKEKINDLHNLESDIAFDINVWGKQ